MTQLEMLADLIDLRENSCRDGSDWIKEELDTLIDKWQERLSNAES